MPGFCPFLDKEDTSIVVDPPFSDAVRNFVSGFFSAYIFHNFGNKIFKPIANYKPFVNGEFSC